MREVYPCKNCTEWFQQRRNLNAHLVHCNKKLKQRELMIAKFNELNEIEQSQKEKCNDEGNHDLKINDNENDFITHDDQFNWDYDKNDNNDLLLNKDDYPNHDFFVQKHEQFLRSQISEQIDTDGDYKAGMTLLQILRKAKAPIKTFDAIIEWAKDARINYGVQFDASTKIKRDKVLNNCMLRYNLDDLTPENIEYNLIDSNLSVSVIRFSANAAIYSLLSDELLNDPENLLEEKGVDDGTFADINTGDTWRKGYQHYIQHPKLEKYIPIILFIDKTHTDTHGRLLLEPILMTLGIFNQETRNRPEAWRVLGFITDYLPEKKTKTETKLQDYHNIIKIILDPLRKLQNEQPMVWKFDGKAKKLIVPILFIAGDTEGADKGCCRYQTRGIINYLCRICNIHKNDIDNPFYSKAKLTKMSKIKKLVQNGDKDELNRRCIHLVDNAFHEMHFCDPEGGNHQSFPPEILHVVQHGLYDYLIPSFFGQKKEKKTKMNSQAKIDTQSKNVSKVSSSASKKTDSKKRKANDAHRKTKKIKPNLSSKSSKKKSDELVEVIEKDHEGEEMENIYDPDKIVTGKNRAFNDAQLSRFEKTCKIFGKHLSRQSDKSLPRTHFFSKYWLVTRKNGHEKSGMLLVYLMVLYSDEGILLDELLGEHRLSAFCNVIEAMLMVEMFCKSKRHVEKDLKIFEEGIKWVMQSFNTTLDRRAGVGMKLIKFHLVGHFGVTIRRWGSMENTNSAKGEMLHKSETKEPSQNTQRRKPLFEKQTAERYRENLLINRAFRQFENNKAFANCIHMLDEEDEKEDDYNNMNNEPALFKREIVYNVEKRKLQKKDSDKKLQNVCWIDSALQTQLVKFIEKMIKSGSIKKENVTMYSQFNKNGVIYRGDPAYDNKEPWYDWTWIDGRKRQIPFQMSVFIDLRTSFVRKFEFNGQQITKPGVYAFGHIIEEKTYEKAHGISEIVDYGIFVKKNKDTEPERIEKKTNQMKKNERVPFTLINTELFNGPCIAVPFSVDHDITASNKWLFLQPREQWYRIFIKFLKKTIKQKNKKKLNK